MYHMFNNANSNSFVTCSVFHIATNILIPFWLVGTISIITLFIECNGIRYASCGHALVQTDNVTNRL